MSIETNMSANTKHTILNLLECSQKMKMVRLFASVGSSVELYDVFFALMISIVDCALSAFLTRSKLLKKKVIVL